MDDKVKAELQAFLSEERSRRKESHDRIVRANNFIKNFQTNIRDVIEPAMHDFIDSLDDDLGLPPCEIQPFPLQPVPTIRFVFQVETSPFGIQDYNGKPFPHPSLTLRANEDTFKIEVEGETGTTRSVEPEEVTATWVQRQLLARLKEVVAASRSDG